MKASSRRAQPEIENPLAPLGKSRSTFEFLQRTFLYLKPYVGIAALDIVCAAASLLFYFIFPQVMQYIIDTVIGKARLTLLIPAIAGLAAVFALCNVFKMLNILINTRFEQNVVFDVRNQVYDRLQRLPVGYFDSRASGDLMARITDDVTGLNRVLIDGTEQGIIALVSIVTVIIILLSKNISLTLYALAPFGALVIGAIWYTSSAHRLYGRQRQAIGEMNATLADNLQGIRQIKTYGHEDWETDRFARTADRLRHSTFGVMRVWAVYQPAMAATGAAGTVIALIVGGSMVIDGKLTLGELISILFYLSLLYEPVGKLHSLNQLLQSGRAAGNRVFDILDTPDESKSHGGLSVFPGRVRGNISFDDVSFSYDGVRASLTNISFTARAGQTIALVGTTGSGKTTLCNLLPAFYRPLSGRITIDSRDISDISLESLRSQIGIVSQETFLFNGTIRENVLYGRPSATIGEMEDACRAADCHEFITRLPGGYDSRVGERGVKLSVGEKQRISIARALLKDPPIMILDEATASVDTATERSIQDALKRLMEDRTSFVIAHRLSTIREADQRLVLANGEIVECGTHRELMDANGVYTRLCLMQEIESVQGEP
ncbi:MAG: ABC transporter ATP-binding protein [Syntrophorhabdus sp.]